MATNANADPIDEPESATNSSGKGSAQQASKIFELFLICVLAGFLNASTITTLAYASGFVSLLGSRLQEELVLLGAAPACLVFSWLGVRLSKRPKEVFEALFVGAIFAGFFVIWLLMGPVEATVSSASLSFLITGSIVSTTSIVFYYSRLGLEKPEAKLLAPFMVAGATVAVTAAYALHEQAISVPRELLYSEGSLSAGLAVYLFAGLFKSGRKASTAKSNTRFSTVIFIDSTVRATAQSRVGREPTRQTHRGCYARVGCSSFGDTRRSPAAPILVCCLMLLLCLSQVSAAPYETATPIKHLVIVMMENHSFDNLFGVYPTDNVSHPSPLESLIQKPINLISVTGSAPAGIRAVANGTYATPDPVEGYLAYHADWDHGRLDGFQASSGQQSLYYFTSDQLAIEWDWAELYSLGDMYFASYLSETAPNRLMSLAGYTPVINDHGPPPYVPFSDSIMGELTAYHVSWGYFVMDPLRGDYPLNYFSGLNSSIAGAELHSWNQFREEAKTGTLPSVSWVMPVGGGAQGYSQGAPDNVTQGELWLLGVVDSVMQSPDWNTSAIFVTYDEGGGYYDQVPPPTLDGVQLGFRVPFIVISPYAKEDYVSNTVLNHGSLIAFIDYNWRLPALNQFVDDSNIPLDVFYFNGSQGNSSTRPPYPLNASTRFPVQPQIPLSQLPYNRTGSSNVTLSHLDSSVYLKADKAYTPLYYSDATLYLTLITTVALTSLTLQRFANRRGVHKQLRFR
jgi:phospholipase C